MHQLLKDREENIQKRPSQGENSSSGSPTSVSVQGRPSGHDNGAVKEVIDDSQNIQKVVSGNGSSVRHNVNTELSLGNNKVDLSAVKAVKQLQSNGLEGFHLYNHRTSSNNQIVESSLQPPMKLKLQLFPIDEATRRALEKVGDCRSFISVSYNFILKAVVHWAWRHGPGF
ncbi:hypothetical protein Sjap_009766 [Stephania japonica]|uniref:Uncharacterized protein n=1 Tax=Stephania japonica TaxID=461633 RepID=A0AAP0P403_9MAGN